MEEPNLRDNFKTENQSRESVKIKEQNCIVPKKRKKLY
jgi:hypothetical protein